MQCKDRRNWVKPVTYRYRYTLHCTINPLVKTHETYDI